MKKTLTMGVIILLAIGASLIVYASNVANSKHNMQTHMTGQANTEICVFCHTPHSASPAIPLWNHNASTAEFEVYNTSATLDGTVGQPTGISLACLGCHDGTTAIDAIGNTPSNWSTTGVTYPSANIDTGGKLIGGFALLGTDLSNDHPISITYESLLDTDLQPNAGAPNVQQYGNTLQLYGSGPTYTVECASCHNVHDNTIQPFLRISNAGSMLCRTCHNK